MVVGLAETRGDPIEALHARTDVQQFVRARVEHPEDLTDVLGELAESFLARAQRLLGPGVLHAGAQGEDAVREVVGQLRQVGDFLGVEHADVGRIDRQGAKDARAIAQRERQARSVAARSRLCLPWRGRRIGEHFRTDDRSSGPDGESRRSGTLSGVVPPHVDAFEIARLNAGIANRSHLLLVVVVGVADPASRNPMPTMTRRWPAAGIPVRSRTSTVAVANGAQCAIGAPEPLLVPTALRDVQRDAIHTNCSVSSQRGERSVANVPAVAHVDVRPMLNSRWRRSLSSSAAARDRRG
jgi:hypothetical protein